MLKTIEIIGPTASGKSSLCKELQSLEINNEQIFFWRNVKPPYLIRMLMIKNGEADFSIE